MENMNALIILFAAMIIFTIIMVAILIGTEMAKKRNPTRSLANSEPIKRVKKIGNFAWIAENVTCAYIYAKKSLSDSADEYSVYRKAFLISLYSYITRGIVSIDYVNKAAAECVGKDEKEALVNAIRDFEPIEFYADTDGLSMSEIVSEVMAHSDDIRNAVYDCLAQKEDHPTYKMAGENTYETLSAYFNLTELA